MKRGWIAWDRNELPPAALERRMDRARALLAARDLPALIVYADLWRSHPARRLANFMPYWNRALLVVPSVGDPILFCALSPRVYPWIRATSRLADIRPGPLIPALLQLCAEKTWQKIGVLDRPALPHDLHARLAASRLQVEDVAGTAFQEADEWELAMRRRALALARPLLARELLAGAGKRDWELVGLLERELRRAGAEDVVLLISAGEGVPRPVRGATLGHLYSITLALEYRGHWVKLARAQAPPPALAMLRQRFHEALAGSETQSGARWENLAGSCPGGICPSAALPPGAIAALHVEFPLDGHRLFYGDTCLKTETSVEPL